MGGGQQQLMWLDAPLRVCSGQSRVAVTVRDVLARYEVGETVGVGGFAVVKRGKDKETGQVVALKVVDKWRYTTESNCEREIRILARVNHPNCIQMHAVYVTSRRVYIVTELVTGGELLDKVTERGLYTEPEAAFIVKQVLEGVAYLHKKGIVHRDLKLENLLLVDNSAKPHVKIADFGLSKVFSQNSTLMTVCGSPLYMAPELLMLDEQGDYSPAVDVWSIGVILFILLAGYSPFDDVNDAALFEKIKSGKYDDDDPVWDDISAGAKDLIAKLLTVDAETRLSAVEALAHPWLLEQAAIMEAMPEHEVQQKKREASAIVSVRSTERNMSRFVVERQQQREELLQPVPGQEDIVPDDGATNSKAGAQNSQQAGGTEEDDDDDDDEHHAASYL